MKDTREVAPAGTGAVFVAAIEQPDHMSRDQDNDQTDSEPDNGRSGKYQGEHIFQRSWLDILARTQHQDLQTRFQYRMGKIEFPVALDRIEDGSDNNVGARSLHHIEQSGDARRYFIVRFDVQPRRNLVPKVNAEAGQFIPLFHDEGWCDSRDGVELRRLVLRQRRGDQNHRQRQRGGASANGGRHECTHFRTFPPRRHHPAIPHIVAGLRMQIVAATEPQSA